MHVSVHAQRGVLCALNPNALRAQVGAAARG
jgi:hypothetical protein